MSYDPGYNTAKHHAPDDGGTKPILPPPKPSDARRSVLPPVAEGCLSCPHPDYCAGMGKCERSD